LATPTPQMVPEARPGALSEAHLEMRPEETYAQVHIAAWLTSNRLNYQTSPITASAPSGPVDGRVWIVTMAAPGQEPAQLPVIVHTIGSIAAVGVFLVPVNERQSEGDLALELAQTFPYVRLVPNGVAVAGQPGVWVRAEAPVDLGSEPPILPGTLSQLFSIVLAAVRYVFQQRPGAYVPTIPTTVQGTHVRL